DRFVAADSKSPIFMPVSCVISFCNFPVGLRRVLSFAAILLSASLLRICRTIVQTLEKIVQRDAVSCAKSNERTYRNIAPSVLDTIQIDSCPKQYFFLRQSALLTDLS